jgi:hypothetical protein
MNLGQMRTLLRSLLNEPTPGFWTDSQLNSYLSMGANRLNSIITAMRQEWFTIPVTFNTQVYSPGVVPNRYAVPSDLIEVRRLEWIVDPSNPDTSAVKLDELRFPRTEAGGEWPFTAPGHPARFIFTGQAITLLPPPDSVYLMRLFYTQRPLDPTTDTAVPTSPVDFHDMIVFYGGMLAKRQNEDDITGSIMTEGNNFADLFKNRKAELIRVFTNRGGEDLKAVEGYLEGIM